MLFLMSIVAACNPPMADKRDFSNALLETEAGRSIRGLQMGFSREQVLEKEEWSLESESDTLLVYKAVLPYDDRDVEVTAYYNFDTYGLFEMQFDLFPKSDKDAERVFRAVKSKCTVLYGRPQPAPAGWRYTTYSRTNSIIEITLGNETPDAGRPFVSLNFLEPLEDEV